MILSGRALLIPGSDVDTDVLYPGAYLNVTEVDEMKQYLFEGLDPSLRERLEGDVVLVCGPNFGVGSSREHVPQAMRAWGIRALVGSSFARIFHRNCINLGLPVLVSSDAAQAARDGSTIEVDTASGRIRVDGSDFTSPPTPAFLQELYEAGGLVPWIASTSGSR